MDVLSIWYDRFEQLPKGIKIVLMVLGFIVFWPIGLAVLGYLLWRNEMGCRNKRSGSCQSFWGGSRRDSRGDGFSSGNMAFDEYRQATLKQLEEDQREFTMFIDQLRRAKDQRQFDDFMSDRMRRKREENGSSSRPEDRPASA
ncbi:MAG: DUF2852 domain-containing protein [bacterium]|nr:DUF2852 domain-containing protein [bacterium]